MLGGWRTQTGSDIYAVAWVNGTVRADGLGMDLRLFVRPPFALLVVEGVAFLGVVRIIRVADELFIGYLGVSFFCCSCNLSAIILVRAVQAIT